MKSANHLLSGIGTTVFTVMSALAPPGTAPSTSARASRTWTARPT